MPRPNKPDKHEWSDAFKAGCVTAMKRVFNWAVDRNVFPGDYFSISTHSPARSDTVIRPAVSGSD
jgi:hypothetical protein